jgi:hypothetical protein
MRKLFAVLAVAAFAAACSDQPTAVDENAPSFRAAQGDRSQWTLIAEPSTPIEQAYVWGFVPCFNGGLGEDVDTWGGPYGLYMKVVNLPSGLVMWQGQFAIQPGGFDYLRGLITGDVWVAGPGDVQFQVFHWKYYPDGASDAWGTFEETLTRSGSNERISLRTVQHYIVDASGNATRADNHVTSCRTLR